MCWLCAIPAICKFAGMTAAAVMSTVCTGANLGKGWTVSADAKYQSEVASFFAMFSDYCRVNARVSKSFKKWTVYLEGRDLADTPHIVRVESADGSQVNHERSYMNRRLVVLGCKWTF